MKEVIEMLEDEKTVIDRMYAPDDMEYRLKKALEGRKFYKRNSTKFKIEIAVAVSFVIFVFYNSDTFAYYGKKLIGYENVMNGTLSHLNELGRGQEIGKSYSFSDKTIVTLDGIMLDDNQLMAFLNVKFPNSSAENMRFSLDTDLKGQFGRYLISSSEGAISTDKTEIKYICTIEPPHFYDRNMEMTFYLDNNGNREKGSIAFKIDKSRAMGNILKKDINQSFDIDSMSIAIDSISASPVNTVIKGTTESIAEILIGKLSGERIIPKSLDLKLFADEKELPVQGSGMSTNMKGSTFYNSFDALPDGISSLKLKLLSFTTEHNIGKTFGISKDDENSKISIEGQEIVINRVYESKGDTYITFTSDDSVVLTGVRLIMDGRSEKLQDTDSDEYDKAPDGKIYHKRTMHFNGTAKKLELVIEKMTYKKSCDLEIDIPVR